MKRFFFLWLSLTSEISERVFVRYQSIPTTASHDHCKSNNIVIKFYSEL